MNTGLVIYYAIGIAAALVAAVFAFMLALRRRWSVPRRFLIAMIAFVPVFLLIAQLLKYESLHMYADVSHWLQLLHSIVTTGKPYVLTHEFIMPGTLNYLTVHFVPFIYIFALPFQFLPYPQTLLILNVLVMSSSAIPLYFLARHRTGDRRFALLMAALLLWYPTFQYTTLYEFEMLRFSIPVLLWMIYAWERQWIRWYYVLVILATLVREEVGLTVGMFGVYLFVRERRYAHGFATALLGFGAFALITTVFMPALRGPGANAHIGQGFFSAFGATPVDALVGIARHPFRALAFAAEPIKLANIGMLFLPLLFLPLLAPAALIPALAGLAIVLVSDSMYTHASFMLYYVASVVPFLFWAFVRVWPRFCVWLAQRTAAMFNKDQRVAGAAMVAVLVGLLTAQVFFGPSPIALQFWSDRFRPAPFRTQSFHWFVYRITNHHRVLDGIIVAIPRNAIVSAPQFLMPRLASRRGVLAFPDLVSRDGTYRAEYVLFDTTNNGIRSESPAYVTDAAMDIVRNASDAWELVITQDGYELYRLRS